MVAVVSDVAEACGDGKHEVRESEIEQLQLDWRKSSSSGAEVLGTQRHPGVWLGYLEDWDFGIFAKYEGIWEI